MLKNLLSKINMAKCTSLLVITWLFLCLTFNSTLPLYKDQPKSVHEFNQSLKCDLNGRSKKVASYLENTLQRIKDSTQDLGKSIYDHFNSGVKIVPEGKITKGKDALTENKIRQYEELVIMKKYPYLDLKELQMKYSPLFSKNSRQSAIFAVDRNLQNEPGICDNAEDLLNVEIINRGSSGFAIPPLLTKHTGTTDGKLINTIVRKTNNRRGISEFSKKSFGRNNLERLSDENAYTKRKNTN